MTFEEFEIATDVELTRETKICFDKYNDPNQGEGNKPALLLEAQFYMQELGRREDSQVARRDLILEIVVIVLIGLEIVLAVYGTRLAVKQGNDEDVRMTKQMEILGHLDGNMQTTAQTLLNSLTTMQSMNDRLAVELGRMSNIRLQFSYNAKEADISNLGNVDLGFWGFKVGNLPPHIYKRPTLLKRNAAIRIGANIINDLHKSPSGGTVVQLFVRDDFNNEFVCEESMPAGANVGGGGGIMESVQRKWSPK